MTRRYLVVYETGPGNLSGFAPDVPGYGSIGHSLEEMRENLREALEFHLEGLALDGLCLRQRRSWLRLRKRDSRSG